MQNRKIKSVLIESLVFLLLFSLTGCANSHHSKSKSGSESTTKIAFFGDSITEGLISPNRHTQKNYPWWVGETLNRKVANFGRDGGMISGNQANDLFPSIKKTNLVNFSTIVISAGVNDYLGNRDLNKVVLNLDRSIRYLRKKNPKALIIGVLPLNSFKVSVPTSNTVGDAMTVKNNANYNENGLCDNLKLVYQKYKVPVLDWRSDPVITSSNVSKLTWDGVLHPNNKGYHIVGLRVAAFILQNS
ncbi:MULTISPECIES: SGNH/GDSL hydrolase family protein [Lactiplantibacillus]|uniref:SGNH/GDSL hydrolase family protein n=1 Tax=Lactiplantibacillus TaxID=2767842 RepID=UPI001BDD092B|nr:MULTISPECIES: SGNH/GDSL hydrolase family protein [Lactiplantibacillus]MBT1143107.1 SGNH/GDSL hydrolase family protein [Lactiplantibacillus argentoratensis]MBT1145967.1 SGNH/GDSL hydrolase family protein [Lactiplantibacillus argentoratensis]MBT1148722.1 SGNH/GDSL hydrolase family protein [Lactiplantibacillus argentoratensis]MBT1152947.1 SGNH/GDSL hydrolase family protein [Lactiplantibacillus argentoratensis]MDV3524441.1 SGNH/GDSL hydrolase family protein [Lactiplantibacillus plantarum]